MQLNYRGQSYSYPYAETAQVSDTQPLRIYRGVKISATRVAPKATVSNVMTSLCYRGISYLQTLTLQFN